MNAFGNIRGCPNAVTKRPLGMLHEMTSVGVASSAGGLIGSEGIASGGSTSPNSRIFILRPSRVWKYRSANKSKNIYIEVRHQCRVAKTAGEDPSLANIVLC